MNDSIDSTVTTAASPKLKENCEALLSELDLLEQGCPFHIEPLTGGVSSDIVLVTTPNTKLCLKFARAQLKVEADWFAPVHRNTAEYAWLQIAAKAAPQCAIRLFGHSPTLHGFAMEYISGSDVYLWKAHLLTEAKDNGEASAVGSLLGRIHQASVAPGFNKRQFQNSADFHALRLEPYLLHTAEKHSSVASSLQQMAEALHTSRQVLIHGDVSPKNILFRTNGPVLLDAECATLGDAAFDIAFCLNHLILKSVHLPASKGTLLAGSMDFWHNYIPHVSWEKHNELQARTCRLLPMLMLARVDGKSPVEYLNVEEQSHVRELSLQLIQTPVDTLAAFIQQVELSFGE